MRIKVPEQYCSPAGDPTTGPSDGLGGFSGINDDVHAWLIQRSYHFSVEESNSEVFVDFLDNAAALDFKMTWA